MNKEAIEIFAYDYGLTKKEAAKQVKAMTDERKKRIIDSFKDNARKAFYND